nr:MAG TPA: hypothetical protein [Caudoviricetes sp.]
MQHFLRCSNRKIFVQILCNFSANDSHFFTRFCTIYKIHFAL